MDERLGRETAHHLRVQCIGLIGVLIQAKRESIVPSLKEFLDALRDDAGFRIDDALYNRVLQDAGEG